MAKNYCIKLAKRPDGTPETDTFTYGECAYPEAGENEIIIKTLYLSVDPIQRLQMNEVSPSFVARIEIGVLLSGLSGVGIVVESKSSDFIVGDVVINTKIDWWPFQLYFKTANEDKKFVKTSEDPKCEVTYYGMPGLTVMTGLTSSGILGKQGNGKTFVVTAAAGSCGHLAGQIALMNGCSSVVGICGSDEKCQILTDQLKFTNAINYKTDNVKAKLEQFCPNGVDVYFDNVGGEIAETVILQMNENARVLICGQIAGYNDSTKPYPHILSDPVSAHVEKMKIFREAFVVLMNKDKFPAFRKELCKYKSDHGIQVLDNVVEGLDNLPNAFCGMMVGKNIGKQVVKVSDL